MTTCNMTVTAAKAHAVLEWTIDDAVSVIRKFITNRKYLESEYILFSESGFGLSTLRWSLLIFPDHQYNGKKNGDPKFLGLFLHLSQKDRHSTLEAKAHASYTLQIFLPRTKCWRTVEGPVNKEFDVNDRMGAHGAEKAVAHAELFGKDSYYISSAGKLSVRAVLDFGTDSDSASEPDHAAHMCTRLADLYASKDFSDFQLVSCDEIAFPVHRAILAAHSPVFRKLLSHSTKEKETGRVIIKDINGATLDILLKFIYSGETADVKSAAEKVMEAADKYDVSDLRTLAVKHLCESGITVENAYRLSVAADRRNLTELHKVVSEFVCENWASLRETPEYLQFRVDNRHVYGVLEAACSRRKRKIDSV